MSRSSSPPTGELPSTVHAAGPFDDPATGRHRGALDAGPARWQISPGELARWRASPAPPAVLDVRPPSHRAVGHLEDDLWIPLEAIPARAGELPRDRPLVVYCQYGGGAARAAEFLRARSRAPVWVLDGGLDEYARVVDPTIPRYPDPPSSGPVVQQFPNPVTGCLAYLLWDAVDRDAVIVDPGLEIAPYVAALRQRGLTLRAIVETHTHADHLSGHARLHAATDAGIWLSHRSPARYPHRDLTDGEAVPVGRFELVARETPGHTRDHLSLRTGGAVFCGDTLLPGSCGRTDLGDGSPEMLWESLTTTLLRLPDETEVFPAHYGRLHGLPPPERYCTTIGFERLTNEALRQPDRAAFVAYMTDGWPAPPKEFGRIVRENLAR